MNHNQVAKICRKAVAKTRFRGKERLIPQDPWDGLIFSFSEKAENQNISNPEEVREKFLKSLEYWGL